jgi:hypothetical protein
MEVVLAVAEGGVQLIVCGQLEVAIYQVEIAIPTAIVLRAEIIVIVKGLNVQMIHLMPLFVREANVKELAILFVKGILVKHAQIQMVLVQELALVLAGFVQGVWVHALDHLSVLIRQLLLIQISLIINNYAQLLLKADIRLI